MNNNYKKFYVGGFLFSFFIFLVLFNQVPSASGQNSTSTVQVVLTETATPTPLIIQSPTEEFCAPTTEELKTLYYYCAPISAKVNQSYYYLQSIKFTPNSSLVTEVFPSCNFEKRANNQEPIGIVLHFTGSSKNSALNTFLIFDQQTLGVSSHYVVGKDGSIVQVIPEEFTAYHVALSKTGEECTAPAEFCGDEFGNWVDVSGMTIGIEIENYGPLVLKNDTLHSKLGNPIDDENVFVISEEFRKANHYNYQFWEAFTPEQIVAVIDLIEDIRLRYDMPKENVLRHRDLQHKNDPGPAFDLIMLGNGYGEFGYPKEKVGLLGNAINLLP